MFILSQFRTGGVYSVTNINTEQQTVQVFEKRDDADRYLMLLESNDYPDKLEVLEVDQDVVAINCNKFGYEYTVISPDDFIIPPL